MRTVLDQRLREHSEVLARAAGLVQQLNQHLEQAKAHGDLQAFNRAYAERSRRAALLGASFPPYQIMFGRSRAVGALDRRQLVAGLIHQVFSDR
jgi:hypothetical protein